MGEGQAYQSDNQTPISWSKLFNVSPKYTLLTDSAVLARLQPVLTTLVSGDIILPRRDILTSESLSITAQDSVISTGTRLELNGSGRSLDLSAGGLLLADDNSVIKSDQVSINTLFKTAYHDPDTETIIVREGGEIRILTRVQADSLNVATATTLLLYEAVRQRNLKK